MSDFEDFLFLAIKYELFYYDVIDRPIQLKSKYKGKAIVTDTNKNESFFIGDNDREWISWFSDSDVLINSEDVNYFKLITKKEGYQNVFDLDEYMLSFQPERFKKIVKWD